MWEAWIHWGFETVQIRTIEGSRRGKEPKTALQEWLQRDRKELPVYRVLEVLGPAHQQIFRVQVQVDGLTEYPIGTGASRREAEQAAAADALDQLSTL